VEYKAQAASGHARALAPSKAPQAGEWAFGAGSQAITFVHQRDPDTYLELGQSWFRQIDGLAATHGHPKGEDVPYRTFDPSAGIMRCFACHSTGPLRLAAGQKIVPQELGVRCEACHGPAGEHARNPERQAPVNPGRYTADAINALCGDCHRMPAGAQETTDLRDPWNARHQPLTLAASRCYRESSGRLSCLTCHSPHAAVERNPMAYNAKCLGCHAGVKHTDVVEGKACSGCHMPAVRPQHHLEFANHRIGIYGAADPLTPIRQGKP
jgi:predicted CXXCH cytochrome family protein